MQKAGRNDPCPCGSGKKFKKCCEAVKGKKFQASVISSGASSINFSSLFKPQIIAKEQEPALQIVEEEKK